MSAAAGRLGAGLVFIFAILGCAEDHPPFIVHPGVVVPGSDTNPEAGVDVWDAHFEVGQAVPVRCLSALEGFACELPNASGVCADKVCRFVACEFGFKSCDRQLASGCETNVATSANCGACGHRCKPGESCQESVAGLVCSVQPICPAGRFDLDRDLLNGCEWTTQWESDGPVIPITLSVDVAAYAGDARFDLAGTSMDERFVSITDTELEPRPLAATVPSAPGAQALLSAQLLDIDRTTIHRYSVAAYADGLSLSAPGSSQPDDPIHTLGCFVSDASYRRKHRALLQPAQPTEHATVYAATQFEVFAAVFSRHCSTDGLLEPTWCPGQASPFGLADYLRAYVAADALSTCGACILDEEISSACLGQTSCQQPGFDAESCSGCQPAPGACPDFAPLDLLASSIADNLYVITRRGFITLRQSEDGWHPGPRHERAHEGLDGSNPDDDVIAATSVRLASGQGDRLFLLNRAGVVRTLDVIEHANATISVQPGAPDFQLSLRSHPQARRQIAATSEEHLLVTDGQKLVLIHSRGRSARNVELGNENSSASDWPVRTLAPLEDGCGFRVLYHTPGRYWIRLLELGL